MCNIQPSPLFSGSFLTFLSSCPTLSVSLSALHHTKKSTSVPSINRIRRSTPVTSAQSEKKTSEERDPNRQTRSHTEEAGSFHGHPAAVPRQLSRDRCPNSSSWMLNICSPESSLTFCNLSLSPSYKIWLEVSSSVEEGKLFSNFCRAFCDL